MPRDFVPCLYREQVLEGRMPGAVSCDVIELFAFSSESQEPNQDEPQFASVLLRECAVHHDGVPLLEQMMQQRCAHHCLPTFTRPWPTWSSLCLQSVPADRHHGLRLLGSQRRAADQCIMAQSA